MVVLGGAPQRARVAVAAEARVYGLAIVVGALASVPLGGVPSRLVALKSALTSSPSPASNEASIASYAAASIVGSIAAAMLVVGGAEGLGAQAHTLASVAFSEAFLFVASSMVLRAVRERRV